MSERAEATDGAIDALTRAVTSQVESARGTAAAAAADVRAAGQRLLLEEQRRRREAAERSAEAVRAVASADACRRDPEANCSAVVAAASAAAAAHRLAQQRERAAADARRLGEQAVVSLENAARGFQRALDAAGEQAAKARVLLDPLGQYASSGGSAASASVVTAVAAPALTPLPGGTQLVPLAMIDDSDSGVSGPGDFGKLSAADAEWAMEATEDRLLPAVRAGLTREDMVRRDRAEGRSADRSYARLWDTMLGDGAVRLSSRPDGRFEVVGGYHRIWMARRQGVSALPARLQ